jgi:hypothetical protein
MTAALLTYIVSRLIEPSTWAGVGLIINAIVNKDYSHLPQAVTGVIAVFIPETATPAKMSPPIPKE